MSKNCARKKTVIDKIKTFVILGLLEQHLKCYDEVRVAGLGRLSAGAKMAMKPFVKRVFTIFATNASFLRVISNFRI